MNEPKRWVDDESAPAGVRELLRDSARARPIDAGARVRVGRRIGRLAIVPASLLAWLGTKSALAALGAAAGLATASVATVVTRDEPELQRPVPAALTAKRAAKPAPAPRAEAPTPAPEVPPVVVPPPPAKSVPAAPSVAEFPVTANGLAEETEFLERARRALKTDPAFALLLVREHDVRFPRGRLGAERSLIEIEALYRSGRHPEARALAERKLASGVGDLYAERVQALLERMDENR
jgi:hypothetical protein